MSKQNQAATAKPDRKSRPKVEPTIVQERVDGLTGLAQLFGGPMAAPGSDTIKVQVARLGDLGLQTVQRQLLIRDLAVKNRGTYADCKKR